MAAVWLPSGVGAAALYLAGLRWWPGLLIADVALAEPAQPLATALAITAGKRRTFSRSRCCCGQLTFCIHDTGCGFDPRTTKPGAGLTNVRERVDAVAGRLEIAAAPGRGTTISGVVPWGPV